MGIKKTASKKPSDKPKKKPVIKEKKKLNLYSNLAYKHKVKSDQKARKQAEEMAALPKNPILRFFAKLRPDRVFKFWFSKEGLLRILKFAAACFLIGVIAIGGLFLYYRKDLKQIEPEELANRVSNTVNTYLDRNGVVLWEDKGSGDYRLVVDGSDISTYMRQATVAIEDKNFYNHIGVDFTALMRAAFMTVTGQSVQGGSTLTQQLIKQVYFADEASDRGITGIPRKIKEAILSLEVEKMYDKEQIITMYLNESPYGGRRNGVESGARTYFNKSAKDLNLAESALLASIPNNPAVLNPYNTAGNKKLINRQHLTLNAMLELGYITQEECDEAKAYDILDTLVPEASQYEDIKAPWAVLETKAQLEDKFGVKTMRAGGFIITTTIDYRAQEYAEQAVREGSELLYKIGADNISLSSVDVETAQVIAMVGSVDWNREGYGQVNASTSLLEPASSIKPVLDYAPLFEQRSGQNFGPGTILKDEDINSVYCAGHVGKCSIKNASGQTYGDITIRKSLAGSLNRPAVKALYINGIEKSLETVRALGDLSYCANGETAGLSMAIGGGCTVRPVEHANTYASLARGGVYKPLVYWLEVKNSSGDIIDAWEDIEGERAIDEQSAYMISDILSDINARRFVFGGWATLPGFVINGVWTAAKSGTTDNGSGRAKDSWLMSYSPVISTAIWSGNHDGSPLKSDVKDVVFKVNNVYMENVHKNVYAADDKWHSGQTIAKPSGIKTLTVNGTTDIWPSWYNDKTSGVTKETLTFDSISKKVATDCTPDETRVEVELSKMIDPMTKNEVWISNEYNADEEDDLHSCSDTKPQISSAVFTTEADGSLTLDISFIKGTHSLETITVIADGKTIKTGPVSGTNMSLPLSTGVDKVEITLVDSAGYKASTSKTNP